MSAIVDAIVDAVKAVWDSVYDFVKSVWDYVCMPILEEVFSWFGIVDETVVDVQKVSVKVFGDNTEDVVKKALIRAVLSKIKTNTSYFPNYMREVYYVKGQIKAFYNFADRGQYPHGLPEVTARSVQIDTTSTTNALTDALGSDKVYLSADSGYPLPFRFYENDLQASPYNYHPYDRTLTFTNQYNATYSDWYLDKVDKVINGSTTEYHINISRDAIEALFWLESVVTVTEGDAIQCTLYCNRPIPASKTITVTLGYSGTAVADTDYTAVTSVTLNENETKKDFTIATLETTNTGTDLTISIASIDNTGGVFETVDIYGSGDTTVNIIDDDTLILTMTDQIVAEDVGTVTIPVKLEQAAAGAFTVDYGFTDGTAIGGTTSAEDYDNTPGTLSFSGIAGEIQNIVVTINSDAIADDKETFEVYLTNCSDTNIDISRKATITIVDGTQADPVPKTVKINDIIVKTNYEKKKYLQVRYHSNSQTANEWFWWFYDYSTNTYSNLDPNAFQLSGLEMLPVAILRKDKVSLQESDNTYNATRRFLDLLGIDIKDILSNVNSNPDINAIDDVYLNFALCPNDDNKVVSKLLYRGFEELIVTHGMESNMENYHIVFKEQDVNNALVWNAQRYEKDISGTKTTLREYIHEIVEVTEGDVIDPATGIVETVGSAVYKELRMYHQKTDTTYDAIILSKVNSLSAIAYNGYHKMALSKLGDDSLTIPISWFTFNELSPTEQLELYQYIFRLDVTCITITELAWYETSAFLNLFEFALIVISIVSLGSTSSLITLATQIAINYAVIQLVVFVAEQTGSAELAAVVGIVATVALSGAGLGFDVNSVEGLINISTNFADNLAAGYGILGENLAKDIEEINRLAEERLEEIAEANNKTIISTDYLMYLRSMETRLFQAIEVNYAYDSVFDYDKLVSDYFNQQLLVGVI